MELLDLAGLITEKGVLLVISLVFLWGTIVDRIDKKDREKDTLERDKKYNESLNLLSESNQNIASALGLLRQSIEGNDVLLRQHDERSIKIKEEMTEIRLIVGGCQNRKHGS